MLPATILNTNRSFAGLSNREARPGQGMWLGGAILPQIPATANPCTLLGSRGSFMSGTWSMGSTSCNPNSLTEANPVDRNHRTEPIPMSILDETRLFTALDRFIAANAFYPCCLLVHSDVRH